MSKSVYDILKERGFVKQVTDEDAVKKAFETTQVTAYVGFDPTADSLHVGNSLGLMALAHLQKEGHRPIAIIGDGTGMIGDPSGKTEMRKMLTVEQIKANAEKIKSQVKRFFKIDGKSGFAVHNATWLLDLNYVEFLRDIGKHFSVNRMLTAEAYKMRLETGLSFIEFNYQVLQAYDFLKLFKSHNCTLQLGGDDQWGNILAGVDLIRRVEGAEAEGITWPLLTTAGGQKMGKTAAGAVWLDANKTSPYDFYQFWINVDDQDVKKCLAYYTFLPMAEIEKLAKLEGADIRRAKQVLAYEVTKITHGEEEADRAQKAARTAFGGQAQDLSGLPSSEIELERLKKGILAVDIFAEVRLTSSKGEARRLIQQGGAYVNQNKIESIESVINDSNLDDHSVMLRAGKKRYHRLVVSDQ
ncbi:tyrosine--tRNA ligase [candidate division KSB1 bacterium]|nr:tyrosine--tRNA ligase [candidate division KSB1 bacterium]